MRKNHGRIFACLFFPFVIAISGLIFFLNVLHPADAKAKATSTTLEPGDLAIIGAASEPNDDFAFVLLVDITSGTEIYFTDSGWESGDVFRGFEGAVKFTAPDDIPAGTNLSYLDNQVYFEDILDVYVGENGFEISSYGDQIFAFQGSTASPSFIYAVQTNSSEWQSDSTTSRESAIPQNLIDGFTAVAVGAGPGPGDEFDSAVYDMSKTSGTQQILLEAISNQSNWQGQDVFPLALPTDNFTVRDTIRPFDITKHAPLAITSSTEFSYTLEITNTTGILVDQVFITDTLPAGVAFLSASHGGEIENGVVSWTVPGEFAVGERLERSFWVSANEPTTNVITNDKYGINASNLLTVTRGEPVTTTVYPVDISLTKQGYRFTPLGEPLVYSLTIQVAGTQSAQNVTLRDYFPDPENIISLEDNANVDTYYGTDFVQWEFGSQLPGWKTTVILTVTLDSVYANSDTVINTAAVSVSNPREAEWNNQQSFATTFIEHVPIPEIQSVADPESDDQSPRLGDTVLVKGEVTAKPGEIGEENTLMFIQETSGDPWSGIPVSSLDGYRHAGLDEGVLVQAVGMVTETQYGDSSVTQLLLSPEDGALSILDRGEAIQPAILQTGDLLETDPLVSEPWESVLVKFVEPEIVNVDVGDGDWLVDDGSGAARVGDYGGLDGNLLYSPVLSDDIRSLTGIGWESSGVYKTLPRYTADIEKEYPVTFIYHDEEDVIFHGEGLDLEIDQSGDGQFTPYPMQVNLDASVFTRTVFLDEFGFYDYRYSFDGIPKPGADYWVNTSLRVMEFSEPDQTIEDYRSIEIDYARILSPASMNVDLLHASPPVISQLTIPALTNQDLPPRGISAQIGYGISTNPDYWADWYPLSFDNTSTGSSYYTGIITPTAGGVYSYSVRFNPNFGENNPDNQWFYADLSGSSPADPYNPADAGQMRVLSPNLSVSKSVHPVTGVGLGSIITYSINITNADGFLAGTSHVLLTDSLPTQVVINTSDLPVEMTYDQDHHQLFWRGDVHPGETQALKFPVRIGTCPSNGNGEQQFYNTVSLSDGAGKILTTYSETISYDILAIFLPFIHP